jgi:hypothetical protein
MIRATVVVWAMIGWKCCVLGASVQRGDILVSEFGYSSLSSVAEYTPTGALVQSFTSSTTSQQWRGADTLPDGRILTTRGDVNSLDFINPSNGQITGVAIPSLTGSPGDIGVLSDGTIVVADQLGATRLYTSAGANVGTIANPTGTGAFGLFVDRNDHIWEADLYPAGQLHSGSYIFEFDRSGNLLRQLSLSWNAADLVVDGKGDLWVASWWDQTVWHLSADGTPIGSIVLPADHGSANEFTSLALGLDGNIYANMRVELAILEVSSDGSLIRTIPRVTPGDEPCFIAVAGYSAVPEPSALPLAAWAATILMVAYVRANSLKKLLRGAIPG